MAEPKWDELPMDCLVTTFAKLETQEIAQSVQFVCKSWYLASLDPKCWQTLTFTKYISRDFVEFAVRRSQDSATGIIFAENIRPDYTVNNLLYIPENCPKLKILYLPCNMFVKMSIAHLIRDAIPNWKDLEYIRLSAYYYFGDILESISIYCKNFEGLILCENEHVGDEEASLIVKFLPKIKVLSMPGCSVARSALATILEGCKELVSVDVRDGDGCGNR